MKDSKNIIIVMLLIIIFFGGGYIVGVNNKKIDPSYTESSKNKSVSSTSRLKISDSASETTTSSFGDVEKTTHTSTKNEEEIAIDKMLTLVGKWGVPQSGNMFSIHEDGSWTYKPVGPGNLVKKDVQVKYYDPHENTIYLIVDGQDTELHIQSDKEINLDYGDDKTSTYVLIE